MDNIFVLSLTIIGGVIGFIAGITVGFAINTTSFFLLYGIAIVFAGIGGFGLSKLSPAIDNQDASTKKALTVLCAIIAVVMFALLMLTIAMLQYLG